MKLPWNPTIVQNGALYQAQHRRIRRDRQYSRLRPAAVDDFTKVLQLSTRATEWLEFWDSYRAKVAAVEA